MDCGVVLEVNLMKFTTLLIKSIFRSNIRWELAETRG